MSARMSIQLACGLLVIAIVTGCTGNPAAPHHAASHHAASRASSPPPQPLTRAAASRCPKTIISRVAGPPGVSSADVVPGTSAYGNGKLVVGALDLHGVIVASGDMVHSDGSIWWKFPWWRLVHGYLMITGRRLDAPAPPLTSFVPNGYGDIGFQASGVIFPSEGCWQVTGTVAHTSLTFVTLVIAEAHRAVISGSG